MTTKPTTAALYLRCSTEEQADANLSLPAQRRALEAVCKVQGWAVAVVYEDAGYSGTTDKRPDFARMMAAAKDKACPFSVVVVWDGSRFSRNLYGPVNLKKLQDQEISVYGRYEQRFIDPDDIRTVIDSYTAREEGRKKSEAVRRGQREATLQGKIAIGLQSLFGYKFDKSIVGKKVQRTPVLDPETAPYLKQLFVRFVAGESIRNLARYLNESKVPTQATKNGRTTRGIWAHNTVRKILTSERYLGIHPYGKQSGRTTLDGEHKVKQNPSDTWTRSGVVYEPLVSQELFDKVQLELKNRAPHRERKGRSPNILVSVGRCKACGGTLAWQLHSEKRKDGERRRYYWYCRNSHDYKLPGADCKGGLRFDFIFEEILDSLRLLLSPKLIKVGVEKYNAALEDYTGNGNSAALEKRISNLQKRQRNLITAIGDGADYASIKEELRKVESELGATKEQQWTLQKQIEAKAQPLKESAIVNDSKFILNAIKQADLEQLRRLLPKLVSKIVLDFTKVNAVAEYRATKKKMVREGFVFEDADCNARSVKIPGTFPMPTKRPWKDILGESHAKGSADHFTPSKEMAKQIARLDDLDSLHKAAKQAVRIQLRYDLSNLQTLGAEALESVGRFVYGAKP